MNGRHWFAIILAGWVWMIVQSSFYGNPNEWFEVSGLQVDDAPAGQDPVVVYSRQIHQAFRGTWTAEVSEVVDGGLKHPCSGSGANNYRPRDIKSTGVPLSEFLERQCPLVVGKSYQVDAVWMIRPAGLPPMEIARSSNVFTILPTGGSEAGKI